MPFEIVFVLLIVFVAFPAVLFRGVASIRRARASGDKSSGRQGIRASELREIIQESVEQATSPLHDRIDTLEGLLLGDPAARKDAMGRIDASLLDEAEVDDIEDGLDANPRAATRVPS